ncbi:ComG operon protein 7 [Alteribacillus persepolensis]|uniref:ComG operon protein 7 n=1 Tax=Alteribacillus persepolensis TaxID=568899 RepID=A0A1G8CXK5_9BACI|nr:competence type IV pilus minor pilin ComGG [Alteribacillus persepolensis]SDH50104.1 ComG operon protein 7 [Alteribacillus persepolensis]
MNEKGAMMPLVLIIVLLFSGMLLFYISVYLNQKENVANEEIVLTLEWLLRNAESKMMKHGDLETENGVYQFPDGSVYYSSTVVSDDTYQVTLRAVDDKGNDRRHSFYADKREEAAIEME